MEGAPFPLLQLALVIGQAQGLIKGNHVLFVIAKKGLVHGLHAVVFTALNQVVNGIELMLVDVIPYRGRDHQNLVDGQTTHAIFFDSETLGHGAPQYRSQLLDHGAGRR